MTLQADSRDSLRQIERAIAGKPTTVDMSEPSELGIRVGNLDSLDDRFKCSHCHLVLRDAMQANCGHRYCKNCVTAKWKESQESGSPSLCKLCEQEGDDELVSPDQAYPDMAMRRDVKKLRVRCPHESCQEEMPTKDLESHVTECPKRPQACPACGQEVPRSGLDDHERLDCPKRLSECDACGEEVPHDELEDHKRSVCIGSTRQCEFCGVRVKDNEEEMRLHLEADCKVGWRDGGHCPYGCGVLEGDWKEHRRDCVAVHIDRLLLKVQEIPSKSQTPSPSAASAAAPASAASAPKGKSSLLSTSEPVEPPAPAPGVTTDFEQLSRDLKSAKENAAKVISEVKRLKLPSQVVESGGANREEFRLRLRAAVDDEDKLNACLRRIKELFDKCDSRIEQCESRLSKGLDKKLEIEKKHQELVKLLVYKEVRISELERRIEVLAHASYDGVLVWRINDVKRRKEEAREGKVCSIYSPPFYTGKAGYKMRGRLYLNGDGTGKNTHISLFFVIMRGEFDALLPWPFAKKVSMMLLDQNSEEHVIDAFKPDVSSSSFKRPTTEMNIASGCPLFMPINDFESQSKGYVKDDTMFIKFIVDKSDLPS